NPLKSSGALSKQPGPALFLVHSLSPRLSKEGAIPRDVEGAVFDGARDSEPTLLYQSGSALWQSQKAKQARPKLSRWENSSHLGTSNSTRHVRCGARFRTIAVATVDQVGSSHVHSTTTYSGMLSSEDLPTARI
ncbi:hypothetical protein, partial [Bradyrhizobium ottawaense]